MKHRKLLLALVAALIAAVILVGCGGQSQEIDPAKYLADAQSLIQKAQTEKSSTVAEKDYKDAISKLNAVAGQFKDKPEGAQALFELGEVYQTAKGDIRNPKQAYDEYSTLINRFDKSRGDLSEMGFRPNEIDKVLALVEQAKAKKHQAGIEQDNINRKYKLFGVLSLYRILDSLVKLTGSKPGFSYWFAIIIVTIIVKVLITPLTKAQFKAMKEMQKISPLVKEIQEKYKGDQQVIGQKTMDLYKEHGINPFASCLPMLIQMPILILLYTMIRSYQFQFEKGTFLWIGSGLSHAFSVTVPFGQQATVWITARNLAEPDLILVLLYVVSIYISTKLSNVDPTQAEQQKMMSILMPVMFAFLFAGFPSAFLLYWLTFNILQTVQQYYILHKGNEPPSALATATGPSGPSEPETPADESPRRPRRRRRR